MNEPFTNQIIGDLNNNKVEQHFEKEESIMDDGDQDSLASSTPSQAGEGPPVAVQSEPQVVVKNEAEDSQKKEKHVDFISNEEVSSSLSREKVARSGSMFVRISNTSVDQERMEEFEKLDNMSGSNASLIASENVVEPILHDNPVPQLRPEVNETPVEKETEDTVTLTEDNQSQNDTSSVSSATEAFIKEPTASGTRKINGKIVQPRIPGSRIAVPPPQAPRQRIATTNKPMGMRITGTGLPKKIPPARPARTTPVTAPAANLSRPVTRPKQPVENNPAPRHLQTVEILGRQLEPIKEKSPYACKIIEIPPDAGSKLKSKKLIVCQKDKKMIEDQVGRHGKEKIEENVQQLQSIENWLLANPLSRNKSEQQQGPQQRVQIHNASLLSNSAVPLKLWPNFKNVASKATIAQTETQTCDLKEKADLLCVSTSCDSASLLTATNSNQQFSETASETDVHFNKRLLGEESNQSGSQGHGEQVEEIQTQIATPSPASQVKALEEIAEKVERGIFTAGEACNVLINTVFKDSLGNPSSLERVLECDNFQEFLHSPNEVHALERSAVLLKNCSELIHEYLAAIKSSGVEFPSNTNFAKISNQVVSVSTSKKNVTLASQQAKSKNASHIWSFVPLENGDKFQLAFYFNPETQEIMQTITCQDHIFRTRFCTSALDSHLRQIISSSREQIGLAAYVKPENLLDTTVRCSSYALARLLKAKELITKCNKRISKYVRNITKSKYQVSTTTLPNKLDNLKNKLQQYNVFAGIMYQMSTEMHFACKNIQNGIWNSMYIQDAFKFPRIAGFPNPRVNKDCQLPFSAKTKIPVQEAMTNLAEGIRGIDSAIRIGQLSLETIKFGVLLETNMRLLIQDYLEGVHILGSKKDIDYGSLLMTLLCSSELINHFEDILPSVDSYVRAAILQQLGQINWATAALLGVFKRMEEDTKLLAMRSTFKLREIKNRYRIEYGSDF